jgi:hypothetical protein
MNIFSKKLAILNHLYAAGWGGLTRPQLAQHLGYKTPQPVYVAVNELIEEEIIFATPYKKVFGRQTYLLLIEASILQGLIGGRITTAQLISEAHAARRRG